MRLLDGATGTVLDDWGLLDPHRPWSTQAALTHPHALVRLHRAYAAAGAQVVTAATFRAGPVAFARSGAPPALWRQAAWAAVGAARVAAAPCDAMVAASLAPLDDCYQAHLPASHLARALPLFRLQARLYAAAGARLLWIETFANLAEFAAACRAAAETRIPFAACVVPSAAATMLDGTPLSVALDTARRWKARCFGLNCAPPDHMDRALDALPMDVLPIAVYPNIGVPEASQDWREPAFVDPGAFARRALSWAHRGVRWLGGCCGSTPDHIAALRAALDARGLLHRTGKCAQ